MIRPSIINMAAGLASLFVTLTSCTQIGNQSRMGMVVDEKTGLMFGSAIQDNFITDSSFYTNKTIKVRTRNTSGDTAFDLKEFTSHLVSAYASKGYIPTTKDDFGLLMDINVLYSGQIQTTQSAQLSIIGALMGSTYGGNTNKGNIIATATGATLGSIMGSFITDDTYMIVAEVTFGVVKKYKLSKKRVTFSRSAKLANIDDPTANEKVYARGFKNTFTTQFTVYAGGRGIKQSEISAEVKRRAVRIAADFI